MGIPCLGPGSEALTFWGGCVLEIAAGQEEAPRPRGTRVPGPRTPSLTGAGVSAGRRLRRRRRCRRSGETRGPNRKCRPFPPTPHQPRASCPEAEVAPAPPKRRRGGWRPGNGEGKLRRHSVSRHGMGGVGQLRLLPVGERSLLRLRSMRPILRAPPTGFSHPARTHPGARVSRLSPAP